MRSLIPALAVALLAPATQSETLQDGLVLPVRMSEPQAVSTPLITPFVVASDTL